MHTTHPLLRLLFPAQPRPLAYRRLWHGVLRAAHILAVSLLTGGLFAGLDRTLLDPWLMLTLLSGAGLLLLDMYSSCIVLFELRGVSVLAKLPIVALLPQLEQTAALVVLSLLIVLSTLMSHATRGLRHVSLVPLHWREKLDYHLTRQ